MGPSYSRSSYRNNDSNDKHIILNMINIPMIIITITIIIIITIIQTLITINITIKQS